jgi:uroporphyrinogen-III decarboxylase
MNTIMKTNEIKKLFDEFRELEQSGENKCRRSMWEGIARSGRDQFRPTPKSDRSWKDGLVPITADIQIPTWSRIIGFDVHKFYFDAGTFLENYLKIMIYRFKNFEDDTFLTTDIPMWGSSALEGSLFGLKHVTLEGKDPELELIPVINDTEDLKKMQPVNFRTSGIMPQIIRVYEDVCDLCMDAGFTVLFPEWIRSPFGVAVYIRGFEDLLVDMITDEEFYHSIMRYITDSRKEWFQGLEKYSGNPVKKANLYNDEVSCPTLSPELYKNKVFPYEQELCSFHGGLHYWHSCGNVSDLACEIAKLSDLDLFNVGPWTSALAAGKAFRDKTPLEICMNPQKDILEGTRESMTQRLLGIKKDCLESDVCGFGLKISALNAYDNLEDMIQNIKLWIEVARKVSQVM